MRELLSLKMFQCFILSTEVLKSVSIILIVVREDEVKVIAVFKVLMFV